MAAIEDLVHQVADHTLREKLAYEVARLKAAKKFGLVFEEHVPELVRLPKLQPHLGSRVVRKAGSATYRVVGDPGGAIVEIAPETGGPHETADKSELVVIKAFGEPMYPALLPVDSVGRSAEKPWHAVINAENYHALQLLLYGYEGRVDLIYIDPPYNTGARDWKYNNDYVDKKDQYRHSKWLSMMKKRLLLAKRLLKPDGVLIVTIDEHEVHHLGVLLEDVLPEATRQMVTIVTNEKGVPQSGLARVEEYAIFAFMGRATVQPHEDDLLTRRDDEEVEEESEEQEADGEEEQDSSKPRWERLLRGGSGSRRKDRPDQFYPVYVDPATRRIKQVGDAIPLDQEPDLTGAAAGKVAWPIRTDGSYGRYQTSPETLRDLLKLGYAKVGRFDKKRRTWTILYLNRSARQRIDDGVVKVVSRDEVTGAVELEYTGEREDKRLIKTVWHRKLHDSGVYGSALLKRFIGREAEFDFPKSLYSVADALRAIVRNKPDALILDFFAGSGTTLHAVLRLNAEDNGSRRCIIVTNNEVECDLADKLTAAGSSPGDEEHEKNGIARSVTWPRCKAAITGERPDGRPVPGQYADETPYATGFEENAAFFELGFLDPGEVSRGERFESIVPILWMFAGARGACPKPKATKSWFIPGGCPFAVLLDEDAFGAFAPELAKRPDIDHLFLVTDSTEAFHEMAAALGRRYKTMQLYRSYIDTFRINLAEPGTITPGGVPFVPATGLSLPGEADDAV